MTEQTQQTQQPNRGNRIGIIAFIAVAAVALVIAVLTVNSTQPVQAASATFLNHLIAEDYAAAYDLMTVDLQQSLGDAQRFATIMTAGGHQLTRHQLTSTTVNGQRAEVVGAVEFADDASQRPVFVRLSLTDAAWRVAGLQFNAAEMNDVANDLEDATQPGSMARFLISDTLPAAEWVLVAPEPVTEDEQPAPIQTEEAP